jgi:hypothetical protein
MLVSLAGFWVPVGRETLEISAAEAPDPCRWNPLVHGKISPGPGSDQRLHPAFSSRTVASWKSPRLGHSKIFPIAACHPRRRQYSRLQSDGVNDCCHLPQLLITVNPTPPRAWAAPREAMCYYGLRFSQAIDRLPVLPEVRSRQSTSTFPPRPSCSTTISCLVSALAVSCFRAPRHGHRAPRTESASTPSWSS